jgi:hypothetical protein
MRQPFEPCHEGSDTACATLDGSRLSLFAAYSVLTRYFLYQKRYRDRFFDKSSLILFFILRKFLPIVLYRSVSGGFSVQGTLGE